MESNKDTSVAIIGAGIAGVSAALYAQRAGLDFLLFEPGIVGGQLAFMESVDNYVGLPLGTKGHALAHTLESTLQELGIPRIQKSIAKISQEDLFVLECDGAQFKAKTLILATGAAFKKLGIEGEAEYTGRGVSYCAICDGFFFKNKDVTIVGGGNTAVEDALYLSHICRKVTLIHRRRELRAMAYLQNQLRTRSNVEIVFDHAVNAIHGSLALETLELKNVVTGELRTMRTQGLFVAIGIIPNTEIFKDLVARDENGFITTDEEMKTSRDRVYACGDCRKRPLRQLITAASEGAVAAISAYKNLQGLYISS